MNTQYGRRRLLGAIGGLTALSLLGKASAQAKNAKAPEKLVMGYLPATAVVAAFAGDVNLWREEELNIEFMRMAGGPAILQAIASGSMPVGNNGAGPTLLGALQGAPYYSLTLGAVSTQGYPWSRLLVRGDSSIRKFSDLQGKTLGVHQRGTMEHIALGAAATHNKVPLEAIKIALIPFPHQVQALVQKQVDAIYTAPPFDAVAERKYGARTIEETIDFLPYIGYDTLIVHRKFADEHPDTVKSLIKGFARFARFINDETAKARASAVKALGVPVDIGPHVRVPYFARNSTPMMANVWHLYHMYLDAKLIKPAPNVKEVINEYFVKPAQRFTIPALDELGWEKDPIIEKLRKTSLPMLPDPVESYLAPWETDPRKS